MQFTHLDNIQNCEQIESDTELILYTEIDLHTPLAVRVINENNEPGFCVSMSLPLL